MLTIKGFAVIPALASNLANTTAAIGELSPLAQTYSRDVTSHALSPLDDVEFRSFSCIDSVTGRQATPAGHGTDAAEIINWIYTQVVAGTLGDDSAEIIDTITDHFTTLAGMSVGPLATNGSIAIPEWISWTQTATLLDADVKVWFANEAFVGQYDEYEIIIVPPIVAVDGFFNSYSVVAAAVAAVTFTDTVNAVNLASNNIPYSTLKPVPFDWVNPNNSTQRISTTWTAVIYGMAGSSIDRIKKAIDDYIMDNTTHTRLEWKVIFPSIFISTEFIITPHFDRYSVPNQTLVTGLYSSIVTPAQITDYALITKGDYTENFVRSSVRGSFSTYKTIAFSIVGNIENVDGIYTFDGKFPDYIPVGTTSPDFARMSLKTQQWATVLNDLMSVAETATAFSSLPAEMSRVYRNSIMFITKTFDGVLYLVMAKSYFN